MCPHLRLIAHTPGMRWFESRAFRGGPVGNPSSPFTMGLVFPSENTERGRGGGKRGEKKPPVETNKIDTGSGHVGTGSRFRVGGRYRQGFRAAGWSEEEWCGVLLQGGRFSVTRMAVDSSLLPASKGMTMLSMQGERGEGPPSSQIRP